MTAFHNFPQADFARWCQRGQFNLALFETLPDLTIPLYVHLPGEVPPGNGYNTGGLPINGDFLPTTNGSNPPAPAIEAALWALTWGLGNDYNLGDIVKSPGASGLLYACAGGPGAAPWTATSSAPSVTSIGEIDQGSGFLLGLVNGALFQAIGSAITIYSSLPVQWLASGGGNLSIGPAQYAVLWDTVTGANAVMVDMGEPLTAISGTNFTVAPHSVLGWAADLPQ